MCLSTSPRAQSVLATLAALLSCLGTSVSCRSLDRQEPHEGLSGNSATPAPPPRLQAGQRAPRHGALPPLDPTAHDDVRITSSTLGVAENSITGHPLDANVLLCANNSFHPETFRNQNVHVAWSMDRGASWTSSRFDRARADPAVAIDRNGTFYVGYINDAAPAGEGGYGLSISSDGGATWQDRTVFDGQADKNHLVVDNSASSPFAGRLHASWTRFDDIVCAYSTDQGRHWSSPRNVSRNQVTNQGSNLQTGPNGELYCCWSIFSQGYGDVPEDEIGFTVSRDGGVTFETPTRFQNLRGTWPFQVPGVLKSNSWPSMAVDKSGGTRTGWIYIFWTNTGVPGVSVGDPDVYLLRSRDGGATWDTPIRVNDDVTDHSQWFAWSACDQANGDLYVIFYDRREDPADAWARAWIARSTDGGSSWVNLPVGDEQFLPTGALGDYLGIWADGGRVYPLWSDRRTDPITAYTSPLVFDIRPPEVFCPAPRTLEGSAEGGALSSDPAVAAFLAEVRAVDEVDPAPTVVSDAPLHFPLGPRLVTFTATDEASFTARCTTTLTIVDTTPPTLELVPQPEVLTPVDQRMVAIEVTASVFDIVDPDASFVLLSASSSEADSGLGANDQPKDLKGIDLGTPDTRFLLRAESFSRSGRTYTFKYAVRDASGNTSVKTLVFEVRP